MNIQDLLNIFLNGIMNLNIYIK